MTAPVVLVTGGCGFIGTWVVRELLERGARTIAVDKHPPARRAEKILGASAKDLLHSDTPLIDRDALQTLMTRHQVTHVIHLAALLTPDCQSDPFEGCRVNVLGSTAVFDAALRAGTVAAIALASSYAVYGEPRSGEENGGDDPPMFYGAFKQAVDLIAAQYFRHHGLRSIAIRPHVVYGPEREFGLSAGPSLACRAAARGERYEIGYTGVAGYDYVEDVARAFVRGVFECPAGATVVDLPSEPAMTADLVGLIEQARPEAAGLVAVSGPPIPRNTPPIPRDIRNVFPDWRATPLAEGIARSIAFYQNRPL